MIIDAHTHIGRLENSVYDREYEENKKALLGEMDDAGVDHAMVIAGFRKDTAVDPLTEQLVEILMSESRLHAIGGISIGDYTKEDITRLDEWIGGGAVKGIKIYLGYEHFYPNDERCMPIYELCMRHGVPVIFHTGDTLSNFNIRAKVRYAHPLGVDDVAAEFPDMKIVIAHLGNPWIMDCAQVLYKNKNVYADISGLVIGSFDSPYGEWLRRKIRDFEAWSGASEKLLYGTDWPVAQMKPYLSFFDSLDFSDAEREKIMSGNAAELFGIEA